jgi:hypothetical protein
MKKFLLILAIAVGFAGCVSLDHAQIVDVDKDGIPHGQFRDVRSGNIGMGGALFPFWGFSVAPTQGDPLPFARSIAMINYSQKLEKIYRYDEAGGSVQYEFREKALKKGYQPFGYQPVE